VNFHLVARVATPKPSLTGAGTSGSGRPKAQRLVDFDESGRLETMIYERSDLIPGEPVEGPAVIEEPASTTVIYPGQRVTLDSIGNLRIDTAV
jgi:N-methylhydantoinase A